MQSSLPIRPSRNVGCACVAACVGIVLATVPLLTGARPESVEALIKRQSQEFSDASASGDAAVLAKYLDDNVTFMSDGGDVGNKKDLLDGVSPTPPQRRQKLVQTDWQFHQFGSIAVTSFTDNSTADIFGQHIEARFRSTEVWRKEGGAWKMISSQTMPVADDPPAIALPAATLDEYVGRYQAAPDYVVTVTRTPDGLALASGNAAPVPLKAEVRDVFFAAGQPRVRRIFQRDAEGHVTGFVSRREGHDLVLTRLS